MAFQSLKDKEYYERALQNPAVRAALDAIAWAEGTKNTNQPYNTQFGFGTFNGYEDHPREAIDFPNDGLDPSTAAGRYQMLGFVWDEVANALGLESFSPQNQDIAAVARMDQRGALDPLLAGDFATFSDKVKQEWASFPGANYPGQGMRSFADLYSVYQNALAEQTQNPPNTPATMNGNRAYMPDIKTIDGVTRPSSPNAIGVPTPNPRTATKPGFEDLDRPNFGLPPMDDSVTPASGAFAVPTRAPDRVAALEAAIDSIPTSFSPAGLAGRPMDPAGLDPVDVPNSGFDKFNELGPNSRGKEAFQFDPAFGTRLQAFMNDPRIAGTTIHSGHRTLQQQQHLFNTQPAGMVARPSPNAPHVRGIAADLTYPEGKQKTAHQIASEYGLHYRMNDPNRKPYEPWHIESIPNWQGSLPLPSNIPTPQMDPRQRSLNPDLLAGVSKPFSTSQPPAALGIGTFARPEQNSMPGYQQRELGKPTVTIQQLANATPGFAGRPTPPIAPSGMPPARAQTTVVGRPATPAPTGLPARTVVSPTPARPAPAPTGLPAARPAAPTIVGRPAVPAPTGLPAARTVAPAVPAAAPSAATLAGQYAMYGMGKPSGLAPSSTTVTPSARPSPPIANVPVPTKSPISGIPVPTKSPISGVPVPTRSPISNIPVPQRAPVQRAPLTNVPVPTARPTPATAALTPQKAAAFNMSQTVPGKYMPNVAANPAQVMKDQLGLIARNPLQSIAQMVAGTLLGGVFHAGNTVANIGQTAGGHIGAGLSAGIGALGGSGGGGGGGGYTGGGGFSGGANPSAGGGFGGFQSGSGYTYDR